MIRGKCVLCCNMFFNLNRCFCSLIMSSEEGKCGFIYE